MLIHLSPTSHEPLYSQLYHALKEQIHDGRLSAHDKLPSKRQLAKDLGVSLNTVMNAYNQLSLEGYIQSRHRQGYYVADVRFQVPPLSDDSQASPPSSSPHWHYDLSRTSADTELFPFQTFRKLYQHRFDLASPNLLEAGPVQGIAELRQSLAHYLSRDRGIPCQADQLILGPNAQSLLQILLHLLPSPGHLGIEDPGYHAQVSFWQSAGWQITPCPLDQHGLMMNPSLLEPLRILCVTPSHQFPTGSVMPMARRQQILDWAHAHEGRWIIEDDYDSEFKYSGRPIPPLAQLDGLQQVIYMGSLSRILSPGLRVSYMVLPHPLLEQFQQIESHFSPNLNTITQYAIHDFIQLGHFDRHLNRARSFYKRKRDNLVQAILKLDPAAQFLGLDAGLHLLFRPSTPFDSPALIQALAQEKIRLKTLADFRLKKAEQDTQTLFLNFSALPIATLEPLVTTLYTHLHHYRR